MVVAHQPEPFCQFTLVPIVFGFGHPAGQATQTILCTHMSAHRHYRVSTLLCYTTLLYLGVKYIGDQYKMPSANYTHPPVGQLTVVVCSVYSVWTLGNSCLMSRTNCFFPESIAHICTLWPWHPHWCSAMVMAEQLWLQPAV